MKVFVKKSLLLLIVLIVANWSSDQTTVDINGAKKNKVNFYGVLHTINGEIYSVENISIGRIYKQIPVYEKPETPNDQQGTLENDPKKGIITKLDLSEIQEIYVPQSTKTWHYQQKDGARKTDYIEIKVNQKGLISTYLIDINRKIMCDQISPSGPIEKEVPFNSLDRILIEGYRQRDSAKKDPAEQNKQEPKKCDCSE